MHRNSSGYSPIVAVSAAVLASALGILAASSANALTFQTIYTFTGPPDGWTPYGVVLDKSGTLYGATRAGGDTANCPSDSYANNSDGIYEPGCGVLFALTPGSSWTETRLSTFTGGADGAYPNGGGVVLNGNVLYGETEFGGHIDTSGCISGCGTVFELLIKDKKLETIHTFTGGSDSGGPYDGVTFASGSLYSVVEGGDGASPVADLVFKLSPPTAGHSSWTFSAVYPTTGSDGEIRSRLVLGPDGNLYGTSRPGGSASKCSGACGTIFKIDPATKSETMLYTFNGSDGSGPPDAGLIVRDLTGGKFLLYGVTTRGGSASDDGTVFSFDPVKRKLSTLHVFAGGSDGAKPQSALAFHGGMLFGTTLEGGAHNAGIAFEMSLTGSETLLHTFTGGADGGYPIGDLAVDKTGSVYGTTGFGGDLGDCPNTQDPAGCGTVFKITP